MILSFSGLRFCMQLGLGFQEFPVEVRVYYYFQIGMYLSLVYSISSDTKHKDFAEVRFCMHFGELDAPCSRVGR